MPAPIVTFALVAALAAAPAPPQSNPSEESLVKQFTARDWLTVRTAKKALESLEGRAIPDLVALFGRDDYVKLEDTADLIYPGAAEFWGHGEVLAYDIDWIAVRAGWALEDLTFQNFGFRDEAIDHDTLLEATRVNKVDIPLADVLALEPDADAKKERRSRAVALATAWWARSSKGWSRLGALVEALESEDAVRQESALSWLRHGDTSCEGLLKEVFAERLLPGARRLGHSGDPGVKAQAVALVEDFESNEWYWLGLKLGAKLAPSEAPHGPAV
jgi:hypothetical protein